MKNFTLSCCAMLLAFTLVGCSESAPSGQADKKDDKAAGTKTAAAEVTHCPLCSMEANTKVATLAFDGKTVGYCSDACKAKFEKMPDDEKKKLIAKLDDSSKDHDHDHDHGDDHKHGDDDHDHDHKKDEKKEEKKAS